MTGVELISAGPVLSKLRVHYAYYNSTIDQDIAFYNDATFDIQHGNVKRATHKNTTWDIARLEVCAHKWADVSENGYGFSVLNDCKYGYPVDENGIALSLIKSSTSPNPIADQEVHHFAYSIMPHKGN